MSAINCNFLGDLECNNCNEPLVGRITAIAFTLSGYNLDFPSTAINWMDAICLDNAIIFHDVRASYDGGSVVETTGYGNNAVRKSSSNHTITGFIPFDPVKRDLLNELAKNASLFQVWFIASDKLYKSDEKATIFFSASLPVEEDLTTTLEYEFMIKWASPELPLCYDKPQKIFDSVSKFNEVFACHECPDGVDECADVLCCRFNVQVYNVTSVIVGPDVNVSATYLVTETGNYCNSNTYGLSSNRFSPVVIEEGVPLVVNYTIDISEIGTLTTAYVESTCNGVVSPLNATSTHIVPDEPCCIPNIRMVSPPVPSGVTGSGDYTFIFRVEENTNGCYYNDYEYSINGSPYLPLIVNDDNTININLPPSGGTINLDIRSTCSKDGSINTVNATFAYPSDPECCQFTTSSTAPVLISAMGPDYVYEFTITIIESPPLCLSSTYTFTSVGITPAVLIGQVGNDYTFSYELSPLVSGEVQIIIESDCSGQRNVVSHTNLLPPCCNFNVEWGDITFIVDNGVETAYQLNPVLTEVGVMGCVSGPYTIEGDFIPLQPFSPPINIIIPNNVRPPSISVSITGCDPLAITTNFTLPVFCCQLMGQLLNVQLADKTPSQRPVYTGSIALVDPNWPNPNTSCTQTDYILSGVGDTFISEVNGVQVNDSYSFSFFGTPLLLNIVFDTFPGTVDIGFSVTETSICGVSPLTIPYLGLPQINCCEINPTFSTPVPTGNTNGTQVEYISTLTIGNNIDPAPCISSTSFELTSLSGHLPSPLTFNYPSPLTFIFLAEPGDTVLFRIIGNCTASPTDVSIVAPMPPLPCCDYLVTLTNVQLQTVLPDLVTFRYRGTLNVTRVGSGSCAPVLIQITSPDSVLSINPLNILYTGVPNISTNITFDAPISQAFVTLNSTELSNCGLLPKSTSVLVGTPTCCQYTPTFTVIDRTGPDMFSNYTFTIRFDVQGNTTPLGCLANTTYTVDHPLLPLPVSGLMSGDTFTLTAPLNDINNFVITGSCPYANSVVTIPFTTPVGCCDVRLVSDFVNLLSGNGGFPWGPRSYTITMQVSSYPYIFTPPHTQNPACMNPVVIPFYQIQGSPPVAFSGPVQLDPNTVLTFNTNIFIPDLVGRTLTFGVNAVSPCVLSFSNSDGNLY